MKGFIRDLIDAERERQDAKWGEQNHDDFKWLAIMTEEVGELAMATLGDNRKSTLNELIQILAVGVAWLEAMDRQGLLYR